METVKKIIKVTVFFIPFILGTIGFYLIEGEPLNDAMFFSIGFYTLNNLDNATNLYIELARWTAPFVTVSGIIMAVAAFRVRCRNLLAYLRGGSIAVYGPEEETEYVLGQLGKRGILIESEERLPLAERYILMGRESENFLFYQKFHRKLSEKAVFLRCDSMNGRVTGAHLNLFFEEETAARVFWKRQDLYKEAKEKGFRLTIVFLRFSLLEQQLLLWGLQNNIFHPMQEIAYHIFGDREEVEKFRKIYHELSQIEDPVVFHEKPWYEEMELLCGADRLIVSDSAGLLSDILFAVPQKCIDVLAANPEEVLHYEAQERLRVFFWRREAETVPNILEEKALIRAKAINLRYASLYSGVKETKANLNAEWGKLNTFTKYSNISSADYHEVRLKMMEEWKKENNREELDDEYLMELVELEHIRWNRYHYLNNWKHGIPENGKNKDMAKRIHKDLVPFSLLSEAEKEKDLENIKVLLSVKAEE